MKNTKRSLWASAISLLLCFSMLLGTTYAWFTDSAVSGSNIITAGNLDANMYFSDTLLDAESGDWKNAEGESIFTYDKWEPGYTEVKYLKIENAGNLSFKWRLYIKADGEVSELADVIDVYYVNPIETELTSLNGLTCSGTLTDVIANGAETNGVLLPDGTSEQGLTSGEVIIALAMHMQEDAGNTYKGLSIGDGFSVTLVATQYGYEQDQFGNSYDANATWPNPVGIGKNSATVAVSSQDGKNAAEVSVASSNGKVGATIPAGVKLADGVSNLTLTVKDMPKSSANVKLDENEASLSIDVHIDGVAEDNEVVMAISVKELLPPGLNMGNYRFYHVEDGETVKMELLKDGATPEHNNFKYDELTGDVVLYIHSFSEVTLVANNENKWQGGVATGFAAGTGTEADPYIIVNADQLVYFARSVGGMLSGTELEEGNDYSGKYIKLIADIDLGDKESENGDNIFYPIGYCSSDGKFEKTGVAITSGLRPFKGTFDGNGNTIKNFYQNTWEMKGDHDWYAPEAQNYRDGMGLFGKIYGGTVKNLTVENFSSDGEITTTGVIAAYADGATFENIAIFNCNPRVYNIGNGGIVGCVGWYATDADLKTTFTNVTVDNSNKISALWGSYDVACGGIVGQYYPTSGQSSADYPVNAGIHFENCHVAAQMDVYNDVCANYQYYAYRYAGILLGSVRENETVDGHSYPKMDGITAANSTVHFGSWNDYYYCEIIDNTTASYTHDYQMSRLVEIKDIDGTTITYLDGTVGTVPASGRANYVIVDYTKGHGTENATCYHFKDGEVWNHEDAGYHDGQNGEKFIDENGDGLPDLKEDKQHIYREFNNLVTGYGWGVTSKGVDDMTGVTVLGRDGKSEKKFEAFDNITYRNDTPVRVGDIFKLADGFDENRLNKDTIYVFVSSMVEGNNTTKSFKLDGNDWQNATIDLAAFEGAVKIVITDYYYCIKEIAILNEANATEKFKSNGRVDVELDQAITADELFDLIAGAKLKGTVTVTATHKASGNTITASASASEWETISLTLKEYAGFSDGEWVITIQDEDKYCAVTTVNVESQSQNPGTGNESEEDFV